MQQVHPSLYRATPSHPNSELKFSDFRNLPDGGMHEKKPKHKRLKKIRSLFLHPFNASATKSAVPPHRRAEPIMEFNRAPPEEIRNGSLCGIANHGNTCYMNAVLQCLSNNDVFAEKLITDSFGPTPTANAGELTDQLSLLMALLWSKLDFPQVSLDFYHSVSRTAPQYYGNNQHDSQEFLLWLLDRLYEEFNTVTTPKVNAVGLNFIKKLFWAQFKSTVKCPNCLHESITFEPYVCISLPVPVREICAVFVSVVYRNCARNRKFGIMLDEIQSVRQLRMAISGLSGLYEKNIILTDLQGAELGRVFYDEQHAMLVNGRHLYALEVPARQAVVDHRTGREVLLVYAVNRCGTLVDGKWFGVPMIFRIHRDLTHYQFQSVVLKTLSKYVQGNVDMFKVWHGLLFHCRLMDPIPSKCVPLTNYHRPFYTAAVERSLHECQLYGVCPHLKLVLEWEQSVVANIFGTLLEVAIKEDDSVSQVCSQMFQSQVTTLDKCLQQYTEQELLSKDDTWTCSNCQQPQNGATKKIGLWNVPEVLVLHLKRFKQDGAVRAKLQSLVEFPLDGLDMNAYLEKRTISKSCSLLPHDGYSSQAMLSRAASQLLPHEGVPEKRKFTNKKTFGNTLMRKLSRSPNSATLKLTASHTGAVSSDNIYDLYAVCNHTGNMNSGHYTAFCRNHRDDQWYSYNDTQVNPISESEVVTNSAYMLFYSRRNASTHHNKPHWSYSIAKHVLFSAVATRSHSSHLLGGGHPPAKRRLDSTSSLPASYMTGRKISDSAMSVPPVMPTGGGRSNWFSPQLNTVREVVNNEVGSFPQQGSQTSNESVFQIASLHQKSSSYDQAVAVTQNDHRRRSRSFEATKQPRDCLSPARSDHVVKENWQDWNYHSYTLPSNHRNKPSISSSLHLPQSGTETCV